MQPGEERGKRCHESPAGAQKFITSAVMRTTTENEYCVNIYGKLKADSRDINVLPLRIFKTII